VLVDAVGEDRFKGQRAVRWQLGWKLRCGPADDGVRDVSLGPLARWSDWQSGLLDVLPVSGDSLLTGGDGAAGGLQQAGVE